MPRTSRRKAQSGMCKLVAKPDLNTPESAPVEKETNNENPIFSEIDPINGAETALPASRKDVPVAAPNPPLKDNITPESTTNDKNTADIPQTSPDESNTAMEPVQAVAQAETPKDSNPKKDKNVAGAAQALPESGPVAPSSSPQKQAVALVQAAEPPTPPSSITPYATEALWAANEGTYKFSDEGALWNFGHSVGTAFKSLARQLQDGKILRLGVQGDLVWTRCGQAKPKLRLVLATLKKDAFCQGPPFLLVATNEVHETNGTVGINAERKRFVQVRVGPGYKGDRERYLSLARRATIDTCRQSQLLFESYKLLTPGAEPGAMMDVVEIDSDVHSVASDEDVKPRYPKRKKKMIVKPEVPRPKPKKRQPKRKPAANTKTEKVKTVNVEKTNRNKTPYVCYVPDCFKTYASKSAFTRHFTSAHSAPSTSNSQPAPVQAEAVIRMELLEIYHEKELAAVREGAKEIRAMGKEGQANILEVLRIMKGGN